MAGDALRRHSKENVMKVKVDKDLCDGYQNCVAICPEVFEMENDVARAIVEDVPEELQEKCRDAADACPVDAIIIEE